MAKGGVFIKPVVRDELSQYVSGWGYKRDRNKYNKSLNVKNFDIQPNTPSGEKKGSGEVKLKFSAFVRSEEPRDTGASKGNPNSARRSGVKSIIFYLVTVEFQDMKFKRVGSGQFNQEFKLGSRNIFTRKPRISKNQVKLKCQCRDFVFNWEKPLADSNGLYPNNRFTKYKRKTKYDPSKPKHPIENPPPRNPKEKMGYCKHIENLLNYLVDSDLMSNR